MWYKINKFITLLYPQWTQGTLLGNTSSTFYQPFSQVLGASPIIRLRVGDVIKSNYSRFALARTFGIGDREVVAKTSEKTSLADYFEGKIHKVQNMLRDLLLYAYVGLLGSPLGIISALGDSFESGQKNGFARIGTDMAVAGISQFLVNGFVNPLAISEIIEKLRDPNIYDGAGFNNANAPGPKLVIIKSNMNTGYRCVDDNRRYFLTRRVSGHVISTKKVNDKFVYEVVIRDGDSSISGLTLDVAHKDILPDPGSIFATTLAGLGLTIAGMDLAGVADLVARGMGSEMSAGAGSIAKPLYSIARAIIQNKESHFMDPANNPFTRAFETTKGRGIAGVIKGISFNWLEQNIPWETDYNARAPIGVDISFQFDVIHDIPPGLDHSGYNRAPLYNVGEIMRNISGDPHGDESPFGSTGESNFVASGDVRATGKKKGK